MTKSEDLFEQAIRDAGATAPRVTPEMVDAEIADVTYHVFPDSCMTVCAITMQNGYIVTGAGACADPANFRADLGEQAAFNQARLQIWPLLGFRLKDRLAST